MKKIIPSIHLAVDIVLFNIANQRLEILLINRKNKPYQGSFCLPGGFVKEGNNVDETVIKVLHRETGVFCNHTKLFEVFSNIKRDPRGRVVSLGYYAIISNDDIVTKAGITQLSAEFYSLKEIKTLGFDHNQILESAYAQLQKDIQTSDIVKYFLPKYFTISKLKEYCEIIYNRSFEKRNFLKYIKSHFNIKKTNKKEQYVSHRPAALYKFTNI